MFWGLVLEPSKTYAQVVSTPFHISMAALDLKKSDNLEEASTLIMRQDETEYVVANLSKKHKIFNIPLALDFDMGEEIEFFVQGQSQIHLTGFLAGADDDGLDESDEDSDVDVPEKMKDIKKAEAAKRKLKENSSSPPAKIKKLLGESLDDDSDEDDDTLDEEDLDDLEDLDSETESESGDTEDMSDDASPPAKKEKPQLPKQANTLQSPSKNQKKKQKHPGSQLGKPNQQQQGNKQNQQQGNKQQKTQVNQNKTPQKNQQPNKTPQKNQQPNKTPQKTPQAKTPQMKTPQPGNKHQNAKSPQGNVSQKKKKMKVENGHA